MNRSKINDPRSWAKWQNAGAVAGKAEAARMSELSRDIAEGRKIFSRKQITNPRQLKLGMRIVEMNSEYGELNTFTVSSGILLRDDLSAINAEYVLDEKRIPHFLSDMGITQYIYRHGSRMWNPANWCYAL